MSDKINILYACSQEEIPENSAAFEFAHRARSKLESDRHEVTVTALRDESILSENSVNFLLISCSADGSVHRNVRKLVAKVKESTLPSELRYCIALLGHAVCKTSAKQMEEQIFAAGRRLSKTLHQHCGEPIQERLETQVELVAPEDTFDPWVRELQDRLSAK